MKKNLLVFAPGLWPGVSLVGDYWVPKQAVAWAAVGINRQSTLPSNGRQAMGIVLFEKREERLGSEKQVGSLEQAKRRFAN